MLYTLDRHFELLQAVEALDRVIPEARVDASRRAQMLEAMAAALDAARDDLLAVCSQETSLTAAELEPEFARMTGTLRLFAGVIRTPAWLRPAIDRPADPRGGQAAIGPNHDVRSMLVPLGPVAVFGASNFPLAYGVCGGDTASALAAGCPVIVKEHPAHPRTGRLILSRAHEGLRRAGVDEGWLGYVGNLDPRDLSAAEALVRDPRIRAVGFTGSRRGGLTLEKLARERAEGADPIPVFAEMGSANPVLITPAAARARGAEIGHQLGDSILARFGQQCTCPGIIVVADAKGAGRAVMDALLARLDAAPARAMLAPWIREAYVKRVAECAAVPGVKLAAGRPDALSFDPRSTTAAALLTTADRLAWHAELREEIFGPAAVIAEAPAEGGALLNLPLPASLTLTIHCEPGDAADLDLARRLLERYAAIAGRVICNGVPTGVRVAEAMVHGGPFAATNRPESTAVGPRAIERWCRPLCWQNAPDALLPEPLRDGG